MEAWRDYEHRMRLWRNAWNDPVQRSLRMYERRRRDGEAMHALREAERDARAYDRRRRLMREEAESEEEEESEPDPDAVMRAVRAYERRERDKQPRLPIPSVAASLSVTVPMVATSTECRIDDSLPQQTVEPISHVAAEPHVSSTATDPPSQPVVEPDPTIHPLFRHLERLVLEAWNELRQDGQIYGMSLRDIPSQGQVIGNVFHALLAKRIVAFDSEWSQDKAHGVDMRCHYDLVLSFELKTSGQAYNFTVFGNRCDGKKSKPTAKKNATLRKKRKSRNSYYLTVNYCKETLEIGIIRFGYLTESDWKSQESETGSSSSLSIVGCRKLHLLAGDYRNYASVAQFFTKPIVKKLAEREIHNMLQLSTHTDAPDEMAVAIAFLKATHWPE